MINDITGVSGLAIIKAILGGERNPEVLTSLCVSRILKIKREEVLKFLEGFYSEEHLFSLCHAFKT